MALNSPVFLFIFLPVFLLIYLIFGKTNRNFVLLVFSLIFFTWSDPFYLPVMIVLALVNFLIYRRMHKDIREIQNRKNLLTLGIAFNVIVLIFFKWFSVYGESYQASLLDNVYSIPAWLVFLFSFSFHLPLGISFFSFQAINMLVDGYRINDSSQLNWVNTFDYLLMFPKAIAGPIVRFRTTVQEICQRDFNWDNVEIGIRRFVIGFAKKTLIADQLALITDRGIFSEAPSHIPFGVAWLVMISFTLQIYYDFSGYTDMAIGLGRMLGFHFMENFNFPYISGSITEFWRRWHISLSTWFRDYVFYPMERKRREIPVLSQPVNIMFVFLLTGLWHGITLPFIAWGLLQGLALVLERSRFGMWLSRVWKPVQHIYALGLILLGWVIFRSPTLKYAWELIKVLLKVMPSRQAIPYSIFPPVANLTWIALVAGIIFSMPLPAGLQRLVDHVIAKNPSSTTWVRNVILILLFVAGIFVQAGTNYHPFIYGEF